MKLRGIRARVNVRSLACAAAGALLPVVLIPESWAAGLLDATEWICETHILGIAAAANAFTMIP